MLPFLNTTTKKIEQNGGTRYWKMNLVQNLEASVVAESMKAAVESFNQSKQQQHSNEFEAFGKFMATELRSCTNPSTKRPTSFS